MKKNLPILVVIIIVVAGASFYGGMAYQKSKVATRNFPNFMEQGGAGARRLDNNGQASANFINGDLLSKDENTITIKLRDGGSKIVLYSSSTPITKMAAGSLDDLQVGTGLMVSGSSNSDGSVDAESIQIRPSFSTSTEAMPNK